MSLHGTLTPGVGLQLCGAQGPGGPGICWPHKCFCPCGEQGLETRAPKHTCDQKSQAKTARAKSQEPRAKREPRGCTQSQKPELISPRLLFKMSPLLESHALQKPVGLSSFLTNGHVCLCPLVQAWAEASSHPGQVIQPPQLTQALSSLCHKLVAPRLCVGY